MLRMGSSERLYVRAVATAPLMDTERVHHLDGVFPWHEQAFSLLSSARQLLVDREPSGADMFTASALLGAAWGLCLQNIDGFDLSKRAELASARLKDCIAFIEENFGSSISVADIAAAASISEAECARCFNGHLGLSPHRYLISHRVKVASQMMIETEMALSVIASTCGFSSPGHFTNVFAKEVGMNPKEYRRRFSGSK